MPTHTVRLAAPAHEMAREEIQKQLAFLARGVDNFAFFDEGAALRFDAPEGADPAIADRARGLCDRVQKSLRSLTRKVVYRSPGVESPTFRGDGAFPVIVRLGPGQFALEGLALALFRYFDRRFEEFGAPWEPRPLLTPTLIPAAVLARCDYFRSFPHTVTFACHLPEDGACIEDFRARHQDRDDLDERALHDMARPEACLSPAVCYHVYHRNQGRRLPSGVTAYAVCGKCFRYESSNMNDLQRLGFHDA